MFGVAELVFRGHGPAFFVLLVVFYPKYKLRQLNKYNVNFNSCGLELLPHCVSRFVLGGGMSETRCNGCTIVLLTKVCTLACKIG